MHPDELFMRRAMDLAERGGGSVSPNPMVGCVLVNNGKIIGEGWHQKFGEPHAEVNAINQVSNKILIPGSTVYVSLEPCSHYGKTPPCADLLINEKVGRVVIGCKDMNPKVNGKGITKLQDAGIKVEFSSLQQQAKEINKRFFTAQLKARPYIILKWAQTKDGFLARTDFNSKWISGELSRQWVHRWRSEEDAILIGRRTAEYDDPMLTVRDWSGRNPMRVLISGNGKINPSWRIFDNSASTINYSTADTETKEVVTVNFPEKDFLNNVLIDLKNRGCNSVLVEGGSHTLKNFIANGLWDEARIFTSPVVFNNGISAPEIYGSKQNEMIIGNDHLVYICNPDSVI